MDLTALKQYAKKVWHFLWYEDSIWSWIANIIIAFILIKFVVYPLISLLLATQLPIVAVVSGSMEHKFAPDCTNYLSNGLCISYSHASYNLCGIEQTTGYSVDLDTYWQQCGAWYEQRNITLDAFASFKFTSGFNTGDVMVVRGKPWNSIVVGDIIVWFAQDGTPIIHRVVKITEVNGVRTLQTKGDHNSDQITTGLRTETNIKQNQYVGVAVFRIPWLGNVKLFAVRAIDWLRAAI